MPILPQYHGLLKSKRIISIPLRHQPLRHLLCFNCRCEDLIRSYPWSKQNLINDWENTVAYWEESEWSEVLANKCGSFQKQPRGLCIECREIIALWDVSPLANAEQASLLPPWTYYCSRNGSPLTQKLMIPKWTKD